LGEEHQRTVALTHRFDAQRRTTARVTDWRNRAKKREQELAAMIAAQTEDIQQRTSVMTALGD
jgi:hypothetical protein